MSWEEWTVGVLGVVFTTVGAAMVVWRRRLAMLNDTTGPGWIRNFSRHGYDPARPGRTKPTLMAALGVVLVLLGLFLLLLAVLDVAGVNDLSSDSDRKANPALVLGAGVAGTGLALGFAYVTGRAHAKRAQREEGDES